MKRIACLLDTLSTTCMLIITVALTSSTFAQSSRIRVPDDQPTIQAGVNAATNGDTVLVAEGTYTENVVIRKKIVLASLYVLDGDTSHISKTIIDGSQPNNADTGSVVIFDTGADTNSVLMGFTLTGGTGTNLLDLASVTWWRGGGGVIIIDGGARIVHNRILANSISGATVYGSGIGTWSAAIPYVIIESNLIVSNSIQLNTNRFGGGALATICPGYIANNIVTRNTVDSGPGQAVAFVGNGANVFVNNTIAYNKPLYGVTGVGIWNPNVRMMNNIIWNPGDGAEMVYFARGSVAVRNNLIRGGFYGDNNLNVDPEFADTVSFALSPTSPCISAGVDTATILGGLVIAPATDFYGSPRPLAAGSRPDLGAVESNLQTATPVTQEPQITFHMIGTRGYFVFLPKNYSALTSAKLLIYLHGCGGGGLENALFRFNDFADSLGFVAAYPYSLNNCWSDGAPGRTSMADVLFIDELIDTLLVRYKIDSTKIFLTGLSSGGFLTFRLAGESRHLLAGIAPFAASIPDGDRPSPPQRPIPMIYFQGTADPTVLYGGSVAALSVSNTLLNWMSYNVCDTTAVIDVPDLVSTDESTVQQFVYQGQPGSVRSASIHFYKVNGGGHNLPGPFFGAALPVNRDINGVHEIMKFFDQVDIHTEVEPAKTSIPTKYELSQNYPNPFNPSTEIRFTLQASGFTSLKVFDLTGREVAALVKEHLGPGSYEITWDASGFPSGTYFYTLTAGAFAETKKLLLLK